MKPIEIIYNNYTSTAGGVREVVNVEATLQAIIDRLNELATTNPTENSSKLVVEPFKGDMCDCENINPDFDVKGHLHNCVAANPKRFKSKDIERDGRTLHFWTEAEAQAALEALREYYSS